MIRYVSQPNDWTCGPTAAVNALKWAGKKCNGREEIRKMIGYTRCCAVHGTFDEDLLETLKVEGKGLLTYSVVERPSLDAIERHLARGGAIIGSFSFPHIKRDGEHYALIVDMMEEGDYFLCVNLQYGGDTCEWVSRRVFKKLFLRRKPTDTFVFLFKDRYERY
jgi:hypothetical protein